MQLGLRVGRAFTAATKMTTVPHLAQTAIRVPARSLRWLQHALVPASLTARTDRTWRFLVSCAGPNPQDTPMYSRSHLLLAMTLLAPVSALAVQVDAHGQLIDARG